MEKLINDKHSSLLQNSYITDVNYTFTTLGPGVSVMRRVVSLSLMLLLNQNWKVCRTSDYRVFKFGSHNLVEWSTYNYRPCSTWRH